MIETLFDPPHSASDNEISQIWTYSSREYVAEVFKQADDETRLLGIWRLYEFRGDEAGMRATEARFADQSIVTMELRYRDVRPELGAGG